MTDEPAAPRAVEPAPRRRGPLTVAEEAERRWPRTHHPPLFGLFPNGKPYLNSSLPFVSRELNDSGRGHVTVLDTHEAGRYGHAVYPEPEKTGVWIFET